MARLMRLGAGVLLLLLSARTSAAATGLESAQAALAAGDYQRAYAGFLEQSPRHALARFTLGLFHREGWGRPADAAAACRWFGRAANSVPTAAHFWADCLAEGVGEAADIPRALELYERAAAGGHLISWCSAADYYIHGRGVPQDVTRGLSMCAQAAQANSPPAMMKLARYFQLGGPVAQDLALARYWYQQAASRGAPDGQYQLGLMLAQGEGGPADLNAALHLLESAASVGYIPAYLPTARMYGNAPVQAETGALAPQHLAKIYLWTAAADARAANPEQRADARKLLAQVLSVMPTGWRAALDRQVAEHVAKYAAPPSTRSN